MKCFNKKTVFLSLKARMRIIMFIGIRKCFKNKAKNKKKAYPEFLNSNFDYEEILRIFLRFISLKSKHRENQNKG